MKKNNSQLGLSSIQPKKWEESSVEEKLDKLKREILDSRYLTQRITHLESKIQELAQHHHVDGKVVVDFTSYNNSSGNTVGRSFDHLM